MKQSSPEPGNARTFDGNKVAEAIQSHISGQRPDYYDDGLGVAI